jgi:import inner membrane translocase subunit TIM13
MDFSDNEAGNDVNAQLGALVLQMLHQQTQKTCFKKCFIQPAKFVDVLGKSEHVCLAKCMDRMYESYAIVTKASTDVAQNIGSTQSSDNSQSYSFQ